MRRSVLPLEVFLFGFALWLGLHLLARDLRKPRLRYAGLGLVAYALGLGADTLSSHADSVSLAVNLTRIAGPMLFVPALLWTGAIIDFMPEGVSARAGLGRVWRLLLVPFIIFVFVLGPGSGRSIDIATGTIDMGPQYIIRGVVVLLPLLAALMLAIRTTLSETAVRHQSTLGVLIVAVVFFGLGTGLLLFPLSWVPRNWALFAIGADLGTLGFAIAVLDAFDEGETLLPDLLRSFEVSLFMAVLFGGQVLLVILLATGSTFAMLALLLATVAVAIATQTLSNPIQAALDELVFGGRPQVKQARAELRAASNALPRVSDTLVKREGLDEDEFVRLTRRALSHFGDLPRLAASPLTRMPLVDERLGARGTDGNTLERAAELKTLLGESIARLKPRSEDAFGTSDEWRYYNALHFPYVLGLRPYSRRMTFEGLDSAAREALEWFRTYVPERTLFNWQNAAARLVAQDLLERSQRD